MPGRTGRFSVRGATRRRPTILNTTQLEFSHNPMGSRSQARSRSRERMARISADWEKKREKEIASRKKKRAEKISKESNEALGYVSTLFEPKNRGKRTRKTKPATPPATPTTPTASQPSKKEGEAVGPAVAAVHAQSAMVATIASQPASAEPKADKPKGPNIEIVRSRRNSVKNTNRKTQLKRYEYARVRKYKAQYTKKYQNLTKKIAKEEHEKQHGKKESAIGSILPTGLIKNLLPTRLTNWLSGANKKPSKLDKLRAKEANMREYMDEIGKEESRLGAQLGNAIRTRRVAEAASRQARNTLRRTRRQKPKKEEENKKNKEEAETNSSNI